jgi:hypothetical protein
LNYDTIFEALSNSAKTFCFLAQPKSMQDTQSGARL